MFPSPARVATRGPYQVDTPGPWNSKEVFLLRIDGWLIAGEIWNENSIEPLSCIIKPNW